MYKIAEARRKKGFSQLDLANAIGTTQQQVAKWESGKVDPRVSSLQKISGALGVSLSYLLGLDDDPAFRPFAERHMHRVPVLGRIAAGEAREAIEQADEWRSTQDELWSVHENAFWLVISGNSMNRLFPDGALVLVDPDMEVRDGDVGAVFVNGDDATVKRVYFERGTVRLHPESWDPDHTDRVIDRIDPDAPAFRPIGRVVSYTAPDGWRA